MLLLSSDYYNAAHLRVNTSRITEREYAIKNDNNEHDIVTYNIKNITAPLKRLNFVIFKKRRKKKERFS